MTEQDVAAIIRLGQPNSIEDVLPGAPHGWTALPSDLLGAHGIPHRLVEFPLADFTPEQIEQLRTHLGQRVAVNSHASPSFSGQLTHVETCADGCHLRLTMTNTLTPA